MVLVGILERMCKSRVPLLLGAMVGFEAPGRLFQDLVAWWGACAVSGAVACGFAMVAALAAALVSVGGPWSPSLGFVLPGGVSAQSCWRVCRAAVAVPWSVIVGSWSFCSQDWWVRCGCLGCGCWWVWCAASAGSQWAPAPFLRICWFLVGLLGCLSHVAHLVDVWGGTVR